jgi:AraC-like DNA-binding protein
MYRVIELVDFSEPFQFAIPPLIYLSVMSLAPNARLKKWGLHFIPFAVYLLYFMPFYFAPTSYKSEMYYYMQHLDNLKLTPDFDFYRFWGNPRMFQMEACYLQTTIYLVLCFQKLLQFRKERAVNPAINQSEVKWWFLFNVTFAALVLVAVMVKLTFKRDLGDHIIASFYTFILYISTISELIKPIESRLILQKIAVENNSTKNLSSGIREEKKTEIQQKLLAMMDQNKLYKDNLLSLDKVAKLASEPAYIVSQVINEKMEATFYDWIARYRVEEAKKLLSDPKFKRYTIEQVAEEVGYNSKSAFNKAFKKFAGKTPSEFKIS